MDEGQPTGMGSSAAGPADVGQLLADGGLSVVYQPIIGLRSGSVIGVEALSRLAGPTGSVAPAEFMATAAEVDLLDAVFEHVLRSVAERVVDLGHDIYVAVNLSSCQLSVPGFADRLQAMLRHLDIRPAQLVLEISEADVPEFDHDTEQQLEALRHMGIRFAADDVGTGYASLSALISLRPEILKIDHSIVLGLPDAPWDAVVSALVKMADSIGAEVVAEGIETTAQLVAVQALGVHGGQGFLLGEPSAQPTSRDEIIWLEPAEPNGRAPRVALVDDDPRLLELVAAVLDDDGFEVVVQECDSAMFLSRLRHTPVDLAVVDLVLGDGEDGLLSVVRPLRFLRPEIEIIVFSSLFDPVCRAEAEGLGCLWIEKADGPGQLSHACAELVAGSARPLVLNRAPDAAVTRS